MSSNLENPELWRLRTPGGIPFRFVSFNGTFEDEPGQVTLVVLITSTTLLSFLNEVFPRPTRIGDMIVPNAATLPGFPSLAIKTIRVAHHDTGTPVDPFTFDAIAPAGTYQPVLNLSIDYDSTIQKKNTNVLDPASFLEISANTTGEFLTTPSPTAQWQIKPDPQSTAEPPPPELDTAQNFPLTIIVPQVEWTITWKQIPFDYFRDVLIKRLRLILGKVNETPVPLLFNADPETLLFLGYTYEETHTWREGLVSNPSVEISMRVLEKRILDPNDIVMGHNEFWRPGFGWQTLLHNGVDKVYELFDYNKLVQIETVTDVGQGS